MRPMLKPLRYAFFYISIILWFSAVLELKKLLYFFFLKSWYFYGFLPLFKRWPQEKKKIRHKYKSVFLRIKSLKDFLRVRHVTKKYLILKQKKKFKDKKERKRFKKYFMRKMRFAIKKNILIARTNFIKFLK